MAKDFIYFKRIEKLSDADKKVELADKITKLFEEGGELAAAILEFKGG